MALTAFEKRRINNIFSKYCDEKIAPDLKAQLQIEYAIWGNEVKLFECRPYFLDKSEWTRTKIARFKKDLETNFWELYYADRNGKWHLCEPDAYNKDIEKLLNEVDQDTTGIFWG